MITNAKEALQKASNNGWAVPHFNVLDANYVKSILLLCDELGSPVIIGFSRNSANYMGGFKAASDIVKALDSDLKIKVPVIIHLDHGSYEDCLIALDNGFTSVMYDGSKETIEKNAELTRKVVAEANKRNASVEGEVGSIGGVEEDVIGTGEVANPEECATLKAEGIDALAAGINTIHGKYPPNWTGIDFGVLKKIIDNVNIPIVLHGGSGIPDEQIIKAIKSGIAKLNVGTQLQVTYGEGVMKYIKSSPEKTDSKWYDPRKIINAGLKEVNDEVKRIIKIVDSGNRY